MRVGGLRDEHGRHRQVDRGAIQVERIARGNHQAHAGLVGAQVLHLLHHARQHRFAGRRAQHDQQLFLDVLDELPDAEPVEPGDAAEHHEDEQQASDVERGHQLAQLQQRTHAVLADGEGHRAEGADGRDLHDVADDHEEHVRALLDHVEHQRAAAAETVQCEAEHHRDQQHLQNLSLGEGIDQRVGDDVQHEIGGALHLARAGVGRDALGVELAHVHVHARTGPHDVDDDQAHHQRDAGNDLEIQQRQAAGLADLLHVLHAGDAHHHRAEDDRRDDHLDELDEAVAQRLHRFPDRRIEVAEQHADDHRGDHLHVQRTIERELSGGCACCAFHVCLRRVENSRTRYCCFSIRGTHVVEMKKPAEAGFVDQVRVSMLSACEGHR